MAISTLNNLKAPVCCEECADEEKALVGQVGWNEGCDSKVLEHANHLENIDSAGVKQRHSRLRDGAKYEK